MSKERPVKNKFYASIGIIRKRVDLAQFLLPRVIANILRENSAQKEDPNNIFYIIVNIKSDFADIDSKYHEIALNVLTSKYANKASFGDNPFSLCKPIKKRRWYQFWKSKYFQSDN
jgi:hypothetical protein